MIKSSNSRDECTFYGIIILTPLHFTYLRDVHNDKKGVDVIKLWKIFQDCNRKYAILFLDLF